MLWQSGSEDITYVSGSEVRTRPLAVIAMGILVAGAESMPLGEMALIFDCLEIS